MRMLDLSAGSGVWLLIVLVGMAESLTIEVDPDVYRVEDGFHGSFLHPTA